MASSTPCRICGSSAIIRIDSYKHVWFACEDCGNAFRVRKDKSSYLIPRIVPKWVVRCFGQSAVDQLFPMEEVIEAEERFYDYYHGSSAQAPEGTKWKNEVESLQGLLNGFGIDVRGKRVLDISGGPGFVAKALAGVASRVVVTEFSPRAVQGMIRNLNVDARKFDYATDKLEETVDGPFDVVLVRYSINFCADLASFVASLRRVVSPGGAVLVTFVPPTLGCVLRWQFDEYTYNVLYQPETMERIFSTAGFGTVARADEPSYSYVAGRNALFRLAMRILPYRRRALRQEGRINRELIQKNKISVYRI